MRPSWQRIHKLLRTRPHPQLLHRRRQELLLYSTTRPLKKLMESRLIFVHQPTCKRWHHLFCIDAPIKSTHTYFHLTLFRFRYIMSLALSLSYSSYILYIKHIALWYFLMKPNLCFLLVPPHCIYKHITTHGRVSRRSKLYPYPVNLTTHRARNSIREMIPYTRGQRTHLIKVPVPRAIHRKNFGRKADRIAGQIDIRIECLPRLG